MIACCWQLNVHLLLMLWANQTSSSLSALYGLAHPSALPPQLVQVMSPLFTAPPPAPVSVSPVICVTCLSPVQLNILFGSPVASLFQYTTDFNMIWFFILECVWQEHQHSPAAFQPITITLIDQLISSDLIFLQIAELLSFVTVVLLLQRGITSRCSCVVDPSPCSSHQTWKTMKTFGQNFLLRDWSWNGCILHTVHFSYGNWNLYLMKRKKSKSARTYN